MRTVVAELRVTRQTAGISQRTLAAQLNCSQSEINRLEQFNFSAVSLLRLSEVASVLGLELSVGVHPPGEAIRDKGQQRLLERFLRTVGDPYTTLREAPFPHLGDLRSWDVLLRLDGYLVGVEAEARVADVPQFVRRIRARERSGGVDEILIVLSKTAHNKRVIGQLRDALGPEYATPSRDLFAALGEGRPLPGSGVVMI